MPMLYKVTLKNNVTGNVTNTSGIITEATPPFKRYIGAQFHKFKLWVERNHGTVQLLPHTRIMP